MASSIPEISYADVKPLLTNLLHAGRSLAQANIYALQWAGKEAALKDFSARPWWIRFFWGRWVIAREARALRRLRDVQGVPQLLATVGPHAILMERLEARRLPKEMEQAPPIEFYERASVLLGALHKRGIAHGDLRRKNLLMDDQARPYLIDFATCITSKPGWIGWPFRFLFRRIATVDRYHLAQMKADFYADRLVAEETSLLEHPPWHLRFGRFFRKKVLRLRKARHRKKILRRIRRGWRPRRGRPNRPG